MQPTQRLFLPQEWTDDALRCAKAGVPPERRRQRTKGQIAEVWLVGERWSTGERKFYLTNHPVHTATRTIIATIKARWSCEQGHQQLKEELGLDHFEGRSWQGLHHHALLTMIALAFLQHLRLREVGRKAQRHSLGPLPHPTLPAVRRALVAALGQSLPRCPHCQTTALTWGFVWQRPLSDYGSVTN
jgi:Transposase DDE domain